MLLFKVLASGVAACSNTEEGVFDWSKHKGAGVLGLGKGYFDIPPLTLESLTRGIGPRHQ